MQDQIDQSNGHFGYNETTHQFQMPPPSGRPDLTFYGSRAVSDTGVQLDSIVPILNTNGTVLGQQKASESATLNEGLGLKFSLPLPQIHNVSSALSMGLDYKHYETRTVQANVILYEVTTTNGSSPITYGNVYNTLHFPLTSMAVDYFPLNFGISGTAPDKWGITSFNAQANYNLASIGSVAALAYSAAAPNTLSTNSQTRAVSTNSQNQARDNYFTLQAGASREQRLYKDWTMLMHVDGQWSSSPLFSNEQFGMGGVAGVRGYTDGEAYGDTGWRVSLEPRTPLINIGMVDGDVPFWVRGSAFVDYGEIYLLEKVSAAAQTTTRFLGAGFGLTANIGSHIDARLTLAFPLLSAGATAAGDLHIYFAVGGQL